MCESAETLNAEEAYNAVATPFGPKVQIVKDAPGSRFHL